MIGLDTNVLIRYIVQDDPAQSRKASAFIAARISAETPGYINAVVLCEVVWVLKRAYHYDKKIICGIVRQILQTRELVVEESDAARQALCAYEEGKADFSDYFIAAMNRLAGCSSTATFDHTAARHPDFLML